MGKDLSGKNLGKGFSQRPDGRYEARAMISGRKIDIYDVSLPALKKRFEEEKAIILRDEKGVRPNLTLDNWYEEWFTNFKAPQLKSDISRHAYKRKVKNTFVKILGQKRIADISQMDVQKAANQLLDDGYSIKLIRDSLYGLRDCFDSAITNNILRLNPVKDVNVNDGNVAAKERRVLSHWEQDVFLASVSGTFYEELYRIMLLTGMRIGEVSALQWDDVDFDKKRIHIRHSMMTGYIDGRKILELTSPKTLNSYRDIPFFGDAEHMFESWKSKQSERKERLGSRWRCEQKFGDLVFTTTYGSPVTRYNIVHDLDKIERNVRAMEEMKARMEGREPREFGHLHPHALRHTFATRCFEKGLDPVVVQRIMGHANYSTTLSYTHVLDDKLAEAVELAGDLICVKCV